MGTYKIEAYSAFNMIIILLPSIATITFLASFFIDENNDTLLLLLIFLFSGIAWYLANKSAKAILEIRISDVGLEQNWIGQFLLLNRKNNSISWMNIKSYEFEQVNDYISLKLILNDGKKFRLSRNTCANDEFELFKEAFEEKAKLLKIKKQY
jgi:hypothetical protein